MSLANKEPFRNPSTIYGVYFLNSDETCVQLQLDMQYDSDTVIPPKQMDAAIKFGVEQIDATDVQKYIVAFMRKLLLQREKINKDMLNNYLIPAITKQWQEVLSSLDYIQTGS